MKWHTKTFVEFFFPLNKKGGGSIISEVSNRNIDDLQVPHGAFGFKFFDIVCASANIGGKAASVRSERVNESPMHYYGGRVYTYAEIATEFPKHRGLLANMERKGVSIIRTSTGHFQGFRHNDVLVETHPY